MSLPAMRMITSGGCLTNDTIPVEFFVSMEAEDFIPG